MGAYVDWRCFWPTKPARFDGCFIENNYESSKIFQDLASWRFYFISFPSQELFSFWFSEAPKIVRTTKKRSQEHLQPSKASSGTWEYASGKHIAGFWALEKMVSRLTAEFAEICCIFCWILLEHGARWYRNLGEELDDHGMF